MTALPDLSAVRERCNAALALAERDALPHFRLEPGRLGDVADYVAAVTRQNYPDLSIPYHSRWRHFATGGIDRWGALEASLSADATEIARMRIELCTVSVLLDAGAGPVWRYHERETGQRLARSEGLAVASLHAFGAGLFSGDPRQKLRVDARGLSRLTEEALAEAFQVSQDNPLPGLAGRAALLRRLGAAPGRIGQLLDRWRPAVEARDLLATILELLGPVWPRPLGDVWHHPTLGMVPFHKLSQWLCYSLIEVLEQASISVTGLDELTGLAEYRNGGLFIDLGVLAPRDPSLAATPLPVDHSAIIEWRALTVALLDRLAPLVRARLGRSAADLPLARLLQGGTWDAGRRIAFGRRPDGSPPLVVVSDGTVF